MTAVVIAGGKSRRMGQDKRFLKVGGISLLDRTVNVLEGMFPAVVLALAEPLAHWNARGHRLVYDAVPDRGSLGGLYTGLMASHSSWIFAVACDMPFLDPAVIHHMAGFMVGSDIVAAKLASGFQPLHGFYSRQCIPILERMINAQRLRMQDIFAEADVRVRIVPESEAMSIDPQLLSFRNVNTPEEFASAVAILNSTSRG
ncbi:MAG: molybdenum cofactor guanylyltransferase [Nitrospiraceae bacterium]